MLDKLSLIKWSLSESGLRIKDIYSKMMKIMHKIKKKSERAIDINEQSMAISSNLNNL